VTRTIKTSYTVTVNNLSKVYPDGTKALDSVSFSVGDGITCIVGPNGAGKTTLVKIIATQLKCTDGKVKVLGYDVEKEKDEIRKRIAVVPQEGVPINELTPFEHVYYYLLARGMVRKSARENTEYALKKLGLWEIKDKLAINLSGGLRRRVLIAMALATKADLMLLDEPSVGLDPVSRKETWDLITDIIEKEGVKAIITTHYMEEAEALAKEVIIMNKGRLLAKGNPRELKKNLRFDKKVAVGKEIKRESLERFGKTASYGNLWLLYPDNLDFTIDALLSKKISIQIMPTSLEDVFMELIKDDTE